LTKTEKIPILFLLKKGGCMSKFCIFSVIFTVFLFAVNPAISAQVIKDDFRINDDTIGGINTNPDVEILESGEAIVVWEDFRNGISGIYGQGYDNTGNSIGPNLRVNDMSIGSLREASNPSITSFGDSLLVIWQYGYGQWLLSDGSKSGTSFSLNSGNIHHLDAAVNDSGFFVVWEKSVSGSGYDIFLKRFDFNGDSIGPRIVVNDDGGTHHQVSPKIAMSSNGDFIVVWEDYRSGNSADIYGQLFNSSGEAVDVNFTINDDAGVGYHYYPSCAMDFEGNFIVVWEDPRDGPYRLYGQRFVNTGSPTGTNFLITDVSGDFYPENPSCAMDSAGSFVVVWDDSRDGERNIYAQRFNNSGDTIGGNSRIDQSSVSEDDERPRVDINDDNYVVTWYRSVELNETVYKRTFSKNGPAIEDEVEVGEIDGAANQYLPAIDMNSSGNTVVVWLDNRNPWGTYFQRLDANGNILGSNTTIGRGYSHDIAVCEDSSFIIAYSIYNSTCYQRFNPSGDSINPTTIISDTTYNVRDLVSIGIDADNNAVVTWVDSRSDNKDIYAQLIDSLGDTIGGNFRVNDDAGTETQDLPHVSRSPSGKALIVWLDERDGISDIYGQIYNSDGSPVGSNFKIDIDESANQYFNEVQYLPDGNFIVVWEDIRSPAGIYAQIVDSTGTLIDTNFKVSDADAYGFNPEVSAAPSGNFIITWQSNTRDIYAQKYNSDYSRNGANFRVNNGTEGENPTQQQPCVAANESVIIFAWSDAKWTRGYDIAAKVCDWNAGGIEDIVHEGKGLKMAEISSPILTGNEWLAISLDSPSKVVFQIINVAGMILSSKDLNYDTPGVKRVDFNVSNLPSGPYFLSFKSDSGRVIKKTLVIR
jgi:hypothetical protein